MFVQCVHSYNVQTIENYVKLNTFFKNQTAINDCCYSKHNKSFENEMIGNKTLCDICSSKAMRKARLKKEKETSTQTANTEPSTETADESAPSTAPPTPTQHHHDEGIIPK